MSDDQAWMVAPPTELLAQMDPPAYDSDDDIKKEIYALTSARDQLEQKLILKSLECNRLRLGLCECGLKCRPPNIVCNTCVETNAKQRKRDEKIRRVMQHEAATAIVRDAKIQLRMQQEVARQFAQQARDNRLHLAIEAAKIQRAAEAPRGSIYRQQPLCACGQFRREKDMLCGLCITRRNNASIDAQQLERERITKELRISKLMAAAAAAVNFIPASRHSHEADVVLPVFTHESV